MTNAYSLFRPLLMALEPERAHRLVLAGLKAGLAPSFQGHDESLRIRLWNKEFAAPLGIAAGFDKDAEVIAPLFKMGFSFVEAGTVTPRPQAGNPPPRIFRDAASETVINRMGFPGKGLEAFASNVETFRRRGTPGILGVNIGINKDTDSPAEDYSQCMRALLPFADYVAVNVSSPNTAGLRDLQAKEGLDRLLAELAAVKNGVPLLLKIAPDLNAAEREDIAGVVLKRHIDGLIISNTTVTRPPGLRQSLRDEKGGLSGRLLRGLSTEVIRDFYRLTQGSVPIIGVGGIFSAEDAYEKIRAGATLIQIYTALIYRGPGVITRIIGGLPRLLRQDGFRHISEAVGAESTGKTGVKAIV